MVDSDWRMYDVTVQWYLVLEFVKVYVLEYVTVYWYWSMSLLFIGIWYLMTLYRLETTAGTYICVL